MKFYFPIHLDGGNRGCEGIAKGTALILNAPKEKMVGLCRNLDLDIRLNIDEYYSLIPYRTLTIGQRIWNKIVSIVQKMRISRSLNYITIDQMACFLKDMLDEDVMVSTGGDMFCYDDNSPSISSELYANERGIKTILWACSMGEANLTTVKKVVLEKFDLIYARESLTYDFFKGLGLNNVVCYPDPAFVLNPEKVELPQCFMRNNVIGLNLSNYVLGGYELDSDFGQEICDLLNYIFEKTNKEVLLIPHVMWKGQDDRLINDIILKRFDKYKNRISTLDADSLNYLQIRYVISQCWCFIGARTHAVISAYSSCVPTIALGYSIKSRGIAKDINLPMKLVVDSSGNFKRGDLLESFLYLVDNYKFIKVNLTKTIPEYRNRTYLIRKELKNIFPDINV